MGKVNSTALEVAPFKGMVPCPMTAHVTMINLSSTSFTGVRMCGISNNKKQMLLFKKSWRCNYGAKSWNCATIPKQLALSSVNYITCGADPTLVMEEDTLDSKKSPKNTTEG